MNIEKLEQALAVIEAAWQLDCITSDVLPAIQTIRQEILHTKYEQKNDLGENP